MNGICQTKISVIGYEMLVISFNHFKNRKRNEHACTRRLCVCAFMCANVCIRDTCSGDTMKWLNSNKIVLYILYISFHVDNNHFQFFNFTSVKCSMHRLFYFMFKSERGWDRKSLFAFFSSSEIQPMISKFFSSFLFICQSIVFMYAYNTNTLICWSYLKMECIRLTRVLHRTLLLLALILVKDIALNEFKVKLLFGKLGSVEFYDSDFFLFISFVCFYEYALAFFLLRMVTTAQLVAIMVLHCTVI